MQGKIERLRNELEGIDSILVQVLNERQLQSHRIQMAKSKLGMPRRDREREDAVISRIRGNNPGPMTAEALEDVYRTIFRHAIGSPL